MVLLYVLFIISLILIILFTRRERKTNLGTLKHVPSVDGNLPVFGHFFKITSAPFHYLHEMTPKYGPIFSIQIGWKNFIVLNNYDIMNKCLKEQGNKFSGRWHHILTKHVARDSGILFKDKEWWATQRSFTLRVLKDFGFGKQVAEHVITRESEKLIKTIRSKNGQEIETNQLVSIATVNIISDFIMKKEYEETNVDVIFLIRSIKQISQVADVNSIFMNVFPIFEYLPFVSNVFLTYFDRNKIIPLIETTLNFISKIVEEHRLSFRPENESHDLIDAFLSEQHRMKIAQVENHSFTDWQLIRLIAELFLAGYETTSTTLSWSFLLLAKFPEVQSRMREEIILKMGSIRSPTMSDKKSLNYCQAVIDEIYRFSTVLPLSIAHRVFEDASVDGYFIPADSIIFPNIYACHRDPNIWENPNGFNPDHFLDKMGKYQSRPELIPFGIGKRQCLGEALARVEEVIVLFSILQKFYIHLGKDCMNIQESELLCGSYGTFRGTVPHKLRFEEINQQD